MVCWMTGRPVTPAWRMTRAAMAPANWSLAANAPTWNRAARQASSEQQEVCVVRRARTVTCQTPVTATAAPAGTSTRPTAPAAPTRGIASTGRAPAGRCSARGRAGPSPPRGPRVRPTPCVTAWCAMTALAAASSGPSPRRTAHPVVQATNVWPVPANPPHHSGPMAGWLARGAPAWTRSPPAVWTVWMRRERWSSTPHAAPSPHPALPRFACPEPPFQTAGTTAGSNTRSSLGRTPVAASSASSRALAIPFRGCVLRARMSSFLSECSQPVSSVTVTV